MPYQPTVTDRTGEFLFRGITGAADSLAEGIRTWRKNKEESAGAVTALEGFGRRYGTDSDFAGRYGDKLAKAPGMSLSQQKALLGDLTLYDQQKRQQQEQANKDREYNLSKVYADLQQGQMNRANERDAAGQRFTQSLASLMGTGGGPSMDFANTLAGEPMPARDVGLADIVQAAGQSGLTLEPTSLAQLLRAEQMGQRGNAGAAFMPTGGEIDINGLKVPYVTTSPNSAQPLREMIADNPRYAKKGGDLTPTLRRQYERDADRIQKELEEANALRNLPGRAERADYLRRRLQEIQTILGPADATAPAATGKRSAFEEELNALLGGNR
jgi:hypothetical protein